MTGRSSDEGANGSTAASKTETTVAPPVPPQVQPVRSPYVESPAEELDVPDFLK